MLATFGFTLAGAFLGVAATLVTILPRLIRYKRRAVHSAHNETQKREHYRLMYVERVSLKAFREVAKSADPQAESVARVTMAKLWGEASRVLTPKDVKRISA